MLIGSPVLASVVGVFLIMGLGAFCRRRDWLSRDADQSLARLCLNVFLPAYLATRILEGPQLESLGTLATPCLFGFSATAGGILIGRLAAGLLGSRVGLDSTAKRRAFALSVGICNYGYIPLPLAESVYPEAVVDLILHNVGVELAMWSVGIAVITGSTGRRGIGRALLSPPLLAVVVSILVMQVELTESLPAVLLTAMRTVGSCAIPIGLLLVGAIISDFLVESRWDGSAPLALTAIAVRQALLPSLMLAATAAFADGLARETQLRQVMMLEAAMPSAVFPIVWVRLYGQDTQTALRVVLTTSLAGVVLIPFWLAVGGWFLGV